MRTDTANAEGANDLDRTVLARWGGHEEVLWSGFVPVATSFLIYGSGLPPTGINPAEMLFVLQLMVHKWDERSPYPSYARLADRMGVSVAYTRKLAAELEKKGFLERHRKRGRAQASVQGHGTVDFDLTALFDRLAGFVRTQGAQGSTGLAVPRNTQR